MVLTRSFRKTSDLVHKPINFDKETDASINNDQHSKIKYDNGLIPEIGNIDALFLRYSPRIRTPSDKALEKERQSQNKQVNSTTVSFKKLKLLFTMVCLVSTSSLHATFTSPRT